MGLVSVPKTSSSTDRKDRFIVLSRELSEMAARENLEILPFRDPQLIHFSALQELEQRHVLNQLETLVFISQEIQEQGKKIRSVKTLTWAFLKHFQCVGPSDLLSHIEETDFVDAYGISHRMLFAGLTFFEVFTYSLEDFFCRSWLELFGRNDTTVHDKLFDLSKAMVAGKHINIVPTGYIDAHECQELVSSKRLIVRVEPQLFAPLFTKGSIIGYLCVNRGTVIG